MSTLVAGPPRLEFAPKPPGSPRDLRAGPDVMPPHRPERSPDPAAVPAERPARLPAVLRGLRVLIVDDHPDTLELFAVALAACGAQVATATSATDALGRIASERADVVVSDVAMPGGDGYWLVGQIREQADARVRAVPVVAVTAYGREHSRARVLASGFTDHLQKPVDPETLCRAVAQAAGR